MERYWDLTEKQRAELTDDQMEAYYAIERMERGAIAPVPPEYKPEVLPEVPTNRYYAVHSKNTYGDKFGCLFRTTDEAQKFIDLRPLIAESDYTIDYKQTAKVPDEMCIVPVDLPTKDALIGVKPAYVKAHTAATENKKLRDEYDKAQTAYAEVLSKLTQDRYDCQALARKHKKITDTFEAYQRTANGDSGIAMKFLAKAFTDNDIAAAFEWFEMTAPASEPVPA